MNTDIKVGDICLQLYENADPPRQIATSMCAVRPVVGDDIYREGLLWRVIGVTLDLDIGSVQVLLEPQERK